MIHVIPHHINKGSWPAWYKLIYFTEDVNILQGYDDNNIERNLNQEDNTLFLDDILNNLNVKNKDSVFVDKRYFTNQGDFNEFTNNINKHSEKYGCKFFIVDDDNQYDYSDNEKFTYFSNRFNILNSKHNFNYFRYRTPTHTWTNNLSELLNPFLYNIRQKKFNFIVGVDKVERLLSLKHIYDTNMNNDGYIGYSGFARSYTPDSISNSLKEFRDNMIPIILDTPFDRSEMGAVNVEYPPFPITLNSYVSAVCETSVMLDSLHLSEKAWNPFISLNIPLILGSSEINTYLKGLGFWLGNDIFDLSVKTNYVDIVRQFQSNLDIINNMTYNDLYDYFRQHKNSIILNHELLKKQKFIFDRNNYK